MRRLAILWLTLLAAFWLTRAAVSALLFGHAEADRETVWSVLCIPAAQALVLGWLTRAPGGSPIAGLWRKLGSALRLKGLAALAMLAVLGPVAPLAAAPETPPGPRNLGFEEDTAGSGLAGWLPSPPQAGSTFEARASTDRPFQGDRAAHLARAGKGGGVSGLLQRLDAGPLRGQRIALRGALRGDAEPGAGKASLFLQASRAAGPAVSTQGPEAIRGWRLDEVTLEVPADASTLELGVLVTGEIAVDADAFSLIRLGRSPGPGDGPPRPLTPRGRENLTALARLVGLLRFFHPSDGAARLDWDRFTPQAVGAVEPAQDAAELATALSRLIAPFAPTVAVFPTGQPPPLWQPVTAPGAKPVAWRHSGLGSPVLQSQAHYSSYRLGGSAPPPVSGSLFKALDGRPLAGRRIRLEAVVESGQGFAGKPPAAVLFLRADRADGTPLAGREQSLAAFPAWQRTAVELAVPETSGQVTLGVRVDGPGRVGLDDVRLTLAAAPAELSADEAAAAPGNPPLLFDAFEATPVGEPPAGWIVEFSTEAAGYKVQIARETAPDERQYAELSWASGVELPDPATPLVVELGGGISARVPLAVLADDQGTLPHSPAAPASTPLPGRPPGYLPSGHDRATRLATVVLAGSALDSFYPFFDAVGTDWQAALQVALASAATDPDAQAFDRTLARLVAGLRDGHAYSDWAGSDDDHRLPLIWRVIGGELTVLAVDASFHGLLPGDSVLEIDGRPAAAALAEAESRVSASTAGFRRLRAAGLLTVGRAGETRRLKLRRGDGAPFEVTVPCSLSIEERNRLRLPRPPEMSEIQPGIWYVDLGRIADPGFERNVGKLAKAKGLIFDLRTYPTDITPDTLFGHLIERRVRFGGDLNPIRTRPDRVERYELRQRWLTPRKPRLAAPVVFLTDERAISRAEIYLSLVTEEHLGTVVGVQTAGTRGERDEFVLPAGYRIYWTAARAEKVDGRPFQGVGIAPDVPVEPTRAGIAAGRDELLERALALLASSAPSGP